MKGDAMTKLLYLECTSGISGDMCAAALLDAGASEEAVRRALESLPVEGFAAEISRVKKSGLDVCDFSVVLDAAHEKQKLEKAAARRNQAPKAASQNRFNNFHQRTYDFNEYEKKLLNQ